MSRRRQPLFLARASYRKRRMRDGARMLPLFGAVLLCLPLFWPLTTSHIVAHWVFVLGVWAGLIVLAGVLSRGLSDPDTSGRDQGDVPAAPPPRPNLDEY